MQLHMFSHVANSGVDGSLQLSVSGGNSLAVKLVPLLRLQLSHLLLHSTAEGTSRSRIARNGPILRFSPRP